MTAAPLIAWLTFGLRPYRDVFRFSGRVIRTEMLCFMLVCGVVQSSLDLVVQSFVAHDIRNYPFGWRTEPIGFAISFIAGLPLFSLLVRRMHDYNQPGWKAIAFAIALEAIAFSEWQVFTGFHKPWAYTLASVVVIALGWVLTLYPPTDGPNRYGPDPRPIFRNRLPDNAATKPL